MFHGKTACLSNDQQIHGQVQKFRYDERLSVKNLNSSPYGLGSPVEQEVHKLDQDEFGTARHGRTAS